jgi:hypothetical protein
VLGEGAIFRRLQEELPNMSSRLCASVAAVALVCVAIPASADVLTSRVVTHNRAAHTIVLQDKSVLNYNAKTDIPEDVQPGDEVKVEYFGPEGDRTNILSIKKVSG